MPVRDAHQPSDPATPPPGRRDLHRVAAARSAAAPWEAM